MAGQLITEFVPIAQSYAPALAVAGGSLIGAASAANVYTSGRVTGISGNIKTLLKGKCVDDTPWKAHFIGGLAVGGAVAAQLSSVAVYGLEDLPSTLPAMVAGGALVGYGTSLGSGCTSGHGVCGLSRASKRSAAAVASFMASAFVTATTVDAIPALCRLFRSDKWMLNTALHPANKSTASNEALHSNMHAADTVISSSELTGGEVDALAAIIAAQDLSGMAAQLPFFPAAVTVGTLGALFWIKSAVEKSSMPCEDRQSALAAAQGSGLLFAGGLAVSGMSNPTKVLSFVTLPSGFEGAVTAWDPSLPWVMAGAICMAFPFFQLVPRRLALPSCAPAWRLPTATEIDSPLVKGSLLFGAGWGLAGLCPGPGVMLATTGAVAPLAWMAAMLAGMRLEMWMNGVSPHTAQPGPALPKLPGQPRRGLLSSGGGAEQKDGGSKLQE